MIPRVTRCDMTAGVEQSCPSISGDSVRPRCWTLVLWILFASTTATARELRQGTVLVAGYPGEPPPLLYVAARTATLVRFEGLVEPRVHLPPQERVRIW